MAKGRPADAVTFATEELALSQRLFTAQSNVRNVKSFFATRRAKFSPHLPPLAPQNQ